MKSAHVEAVSNIKNVMAEFSQYSIACVIGIPPLLRKDCGNRAVMNPHEGLGKRNPQQVAGEQFRFVFNMAKLALAAYL